MEISWGWGVWWGWGFCNSVELEPIQLLLLLLYFTFFNFPFYGRAGYSIPRDKHFDDTGNGQ